MIVFGTRGKVVKGPQRRGVPCSACGMDVHATYGVLRYFHVFWIPMFPTLQRPAMECLHCKKALVGNEIPERVRKDVAAAVFTRGRVLATFAGLVLAALLAIPVAFGAAAQSARETEYLNAPAVGDQYVVKLAPFLKAPDAKHTYGVLRVAKLSGDQLEVALGTYAYSIQSAATKAIGSGDTARADYFSPRSIAMTRADLLRLKQDHTIQAVRR